MKCESVEKGFLQYYGSPGQVCTDEREEMTYAKTWISV